MYIVNFFILNDYAVKKNHLVNYNIVSYDLFSDISINEVINFFVFDICKYLNIYLIYVFNIFTVYIFTYSFQKKLYHLVIFL